LDPAHRELERRGEEIVSRASESGLALLARYGLALHSFSDLNQRIPHDLALELLDNAIRVTRDATFPLSAGRNALRGDFGVVDYVALSAPTLRDSIAASVRYMPVLHDGAVIELEEHQELARWKHCLRSGLASPRAANEYVVAAFFGAACRGLGFDATPMEVGFMHEAPTNTEQYSELFKAPLRFGCETNYMLLPRVALDLPLATSEPPLQSIMVHHADELLQRLPSTQPFSRRVRAILAEQLQQGAPLGALAQLFNMSESSVQRRLQAEGTSHSEIIDDLRRERATALLTQGEATLSEIAFQLGFAHPPALHRAFKRWYAVSPTEFRKRNGRSKFYDFYDHPEG